MHVRICGGPGWGTTQVYPAQLSSHDLELGAPSLVERLELPDLTDSIPRAARVEAVNVSPTLAVRIPPYSLTRLIWNSR